MTAWPVVDSGVSPKTTIDSTMWTDTTRALHARSGLALPTDLTDAEWRVLEPLLPPASVVGRPRKWPLRRIGCGAGLRAGRRHAGCVADRPLGP